MNLERAREILLDHAINPRNRITGRPSFDSSLQLFQGECRNPLCGDHVRVFLACEDSCILACALHVQGCTMCTASASMMGEHLKSLACRDANALREIFEEAIMGRADLPWPPVLTRFEAFSHLRLSRARIPCALIPWYALKEALLSAGRTGRDAS